MGRMSRGPFWGSISIMLILSLTACSTAAPGTSHVTSATFASAGTTPVVTSEEPVTDVAPSETSDVTSVTSPVPEGFLAQ